MATNNFDENLVKSSKEVRSSEEQLLNAPYGQQGGMVICREHQIYKGDFYCIMACRDDVILDGDGTTVNWTEASTSQGNPNILSSEWITHIPLPVGMPFYGDFKAIMLFDQGPGGAHIQGHCPECPKLIAYYK